MTICRFGVVRISKIMTICLLGVVRMGGGGDWKGNSTRD